jgi:hypothetical protein
MESWARGERVFPPMQVEIPGGNIDHQRRGMRTAAAQGQGVTEEVRCADCGRSRPGAGICGRPRGGAGDQGEVREIIEELTRILPERMRIHPLGDFYPAGDEFILVYEVTGKVIPRGGLPLHVGALVMNVETVLNIVLDQPVVDKYLTVGGAVQNPATLQVPLGITVREAINACGGATVEAVSGARGRRHDGEAGAGSGAADHQNHRRTTGISC